MKPTRYASCNYKRILPYIEGMNEDDDHRRYAAPGFMPLVFEFLHYSDRHGNPVFSVTHYGEQNGDLMADPDMQIAVDFSAGQVEPLTFQNDYMGIYQEVYKRDARGLVYSPRLRSELDDFLRQWLKNIQMQGYELEKKAAAV